jgi:hypothetical protein
MASFRRGGDDGGHTHTFRLRDVRHVAFRAPLDDELSRLRATLRDSRETQ